MDRYSLEAYVLESFPPPAVKAQGPICIPNPARLQRLHANRLALKAAWRGAAGWASVHREQTQPGETPMKSPICDMLGIEFPLLAFSHCRDVVAAVSRA